MLYHKPNNQKVKTSFTQALLLATERIDVPSLATTHSKRFAFIFKYEYNEWHLRGGEHVVSSQSYSNDTLTIVEVTI